MEEKEKRIWLMSLSEEKASSLPKEDWYDRLRYLREIEGMKRIGSNSITEKVQSYPNITPFTPNKDQKYWQN